MERIVLFGAGVKLHFFLKSMKAIRQLQDDIIITICDNDNNKVGKKINGLEICNPLVLKQIKFDSVIITSQYDYEISEQLKKDYGLMDNVYTIEKYIMKKTIQYNYEINELRNNSIHLKSDDVFDRKSMVIYTAIIGDYDVLKDPIYINNDYKYVCFTDNKSLKSNIWEIHYVDCKQDPRQAVREYKLLPHNFFPEYKTSIWVDASYTICGDLALYAEKYQKHSPLLFFPHFERIGIYEEAAECISKNICEKEILIKQINKYVNDGYPFNNGLVCGGCMVRQHNNELVKKVMNDWWNEVCLYSKRDQVSIPYIMWKNNACYDLSTEYCQNNEWLSNGDHKF